MKFWDFLRMVWSKNGDAFGIFPCTLCESAPHHFSQSYQSVLARAAMRGDFWMVILHVNRLLNGQLLGHPWTCWGWWDPCSSGSHSIHRTTLPAFWNQHFAWWFCDHHWGGLINSSAFVISSTMAHHPWRSRHGYRRLHHRARGKPLHPSIVEVQHALNMLQYICI